MCTKSGEDWTRSSGDMIADRQTERQTDTLITILCSFTGSGVKNLSNAVCQQCIPLLAFPYNWLSFIQLLNTKRVLTIVRLRIYGTGSHNQMCFLSQPTKLKQ